jgi:hypothetical protein
MVIGYTKGWHRLFTPRSLLLLTFGVVDAGHLYYAHFLKAQNEIRTYLERAKVNLSTPQVIPVV